MGKKVIIVGGGRVGYYLIRALSERKRDIVLIEHDRRVCKEVANTLDVPVIWGDGSTAAVLGRAGVREAEALIAVTGKDEVNLIACEIAKLVYQAPKTIAKVNNPKNVESMKRLGVDIVISATDSIIRLFEREVDHRAIREMIPLNDGRAAVYEVELPEDFAYSGRELVNIGLPESCNIISVTRGGELIIPRGRTKLMSGDTLLIVSETGTVGEVRRALKLKKTTN
ncbi:MAG: NAD-binding protein [Bacteroides sp.]|nr:NAD-binding protein [Eubacterium sp.]MCM1417746.1 NAD-binding protein [Roseburia sp.]MCM1461363.1 NAD-binding protein [Bacteroides sp.]